VPVLQAIVRLLTLLLLVVLALAGVAAIVVAVSGGNASLAESVGLPAVRDAVSGFLERLEGGRAAALVALIAAGAVLIGLLLLVGILVPTRERRFVLSEGQHGRLAARRGALGDVAEALVARPRWVEVSKVKPRPARRGAGGRLALTVASPRRDPEGDIQKTARERLEPLTERFKIKARVRTGRDHGAERVG